MIKFITSRARWQSLALFAVAMSVSTSAQEAVDPETPVVPSIETSADLEVPVPDVPADADIQVKTPGANADLPSSQQIMPQRSLGLDDDDNAYDPSVLPQVIDGRFSLPALQPPTLSTDEIGNGRTPPGIKRRDFVPQVLAESADQREPDWNWSICQWEAANTFSNPRYFEDRMLERHGHRRFGFMQPVISGARFYGSFALLPYQMTIRPGNECEYTLGYYRPGSAVPGFIQRPPYDRDAAIIQSATSAGLMLIFP